MSSSLTAFRDYSLYFGDIHNHCGLSYGYGSIDDAFYNARMQLDFASVTGHASWPDMPRGEGRLDPVVAYHERGFRRFEESWQEYLAATEANNEPGRFVTFPSFEWHSMHDGDYVLYYRESGGSLFTASRLSDLRSHIAALGLDRSLVLLVPHHIGYQTGFRGINWESFGEGLSPVIEIISMHGCAESEDGPFPYLHTMGPRVGANTMQGGLALGHRFGVIGSTDHHNAHPGSFGHGRIAVWADSLTRSGVWQAICERRTYALSGDKIALAFSLNGRPMGSEVDCAGAREIEIEVEGSYAIERVELLRNGEVIERYLSEPAGRPTSSRGSASPNGAMAGAPATGGSGSGRRGKLLIEVGWGETNVVQRWNVRAEIVRGRLVGVEPRFRGIDIVDPNAALPDSSGAVSREHPHRLSSLGWDEERIAWFETVTFGNSTPSTDSTQGIGMTVEGEADGVLRLTVNGETRELPFSELERGSASGHLGGFLTGAYHVHRLVREEEYRAKLTFTDPSGSLRSGAGTPAAGGQRGADYYYVRVAQKNGQWAWSSPIWVGGR